MNNVIFDYIIEGTYTIHENTIKEKGGRIFYISPKKKAFQNIRDWKKLLNEQKGSCKTVYFNLYSWAWIFPILIALHKGYKVVVHAHNNNLYDCSRLQKVLHLFNRTVQKGLKIERLTNSELSSKFCFDNKPAELIFCSIDTDRFKYNEEVRKQIRKSSGIEEKNVYGFVGRITPTKNPFFLINIFNEIHKTDPNSVFLICGEGEMLPEVKQLAKDYNLNVIFQGAVDNIQDYYQAMDAFILPSKSEGLGMVLIEAQCSGLPCYASADVIPKDVKITDLVHFISLKNMPQSWAEEIIKFKEHGNREQYSEIVKSTRFDITKEALLLEKFLQ